MAIDQLVAEVRQQQSGHIVVSLSPKRIEPVVSGTSARSGDSPK